MMLNPGMKVSTRGQLAGMKFDPGMKYLFFACNRNWFFILKTMARRDEV